MLRRATGVAVFLFICAQGAYGAFMAVPMAPASMDSLLGAGAQPVASMQTAYMDSGGDLKAEVSYQTFRNDAGQYLYLYQILNTGNDPVEQFTLKPVAGLSSSPEIGYLTGTVPAGFLSTAGQVPESEGGYYTPGPLVGFYFNVRSGYQIEPDMHSEVLYIKSSAGPGTVHGSVIDGIPASALMAGPVPEPGCLGLLGVAAIGMLLRRRAAA